MLYINFLCIVLSTLVPYTEEFDPENFYLQWPTRTKMQHMYENILKEGNYSHKFSRSPDLQENNFQVLHSEIALDKVDLGCAATVKDKPTGNDSDFITY